MLLKLSAVLLLQVITAQIYVDTLFEDYPNMGCQMINGYMNGLPGLSYVQVIDPNSPTGVYHVTIPNAQPLHKINATDNPGLSNRKRNQSCGKTYCRDLLLHGPTYNFNGVPSTRVRVPKFSLGAAGNYGWNYVGLQFVGGGGVVGNLDCDEYPYASSWEGGTSGGFQPLANCIPFKENQDHGRDVLKPPLLGVSDRTPYTLRLFGFPYMLVTSYNPFRALCPVACMHIDRMPPGTQAGPNLRFVSPEIVCVV